MCNEDPKIFESLGGGPSREKLGEECLQFANELCSKTNFFHRQWSGSIQFYASEFRLIMVRNTIVFVNHLGFRVVWWRCSRLLSTEVARSRCRFSLVNRSIVFFSNKIPTSREHQMASRFGRV